jgi:hypothetical protein
MCRPRYKRIGRERIYDYDEIQRRILLKEDNKVIANDIGCHITTVNLIRQKMGIYQKTCISLKRQLETA